MKVGHQTVNLWSASSELVRSQPPPILKDNVMTENTYLKVGPCAECAKCQPYLKDGETPSECIARNRQDWSRATAELAAARERADALERDLYDERKFSQRVMSKNERYRVALDQVRCCSSDWEMVESIAEKALTAEAEKEDKS